MEGTEDCYRKQAEAVANKLQEYNNMTDGWTVSKSTKHFVISYRPSCEYGGNLYKGEAVLAAKPRTVFDYVEPLPDGKRAQWDKNMKKIEVIKKISDDIRINRVCTASACMGLISPRDFVDLIIIKSTDKYLSTNAVSITCDDCPVDSNHVRGHNHSCGMIVCKYPNEPNKCKLVSLVQPDIKGMLPRNLVDSAIPGSMAEFFTSLRAALIKDCALVEDEEGIQQTADVAS